MKQLLMALGLALAIPMTAQAQTQDEVGAAEQGQAGPLTLGEWSKLSRSERQALVLASIESLFLAMADHPAHSELMDEQCLSGITPKHVERVMREVASEKPDLPFVDTFLALTQCYGRAAE